MKISKSRLKAIIKEELGRSDGEFKCSELQSSWDEAYGEFQRAGGRKNADALQVWDSISTNLKKQAKQLVVSGQVGLCPLLTTDEFEMGRGELKSSGGKDVGFIPETEQLGLDLGDEPASEEGPDKYQSHYEGSKLVRGPGWAELTQKLKKVEPIFPLAAKIAKMLNSFGSYSTYKLHQLEKAVDRGDWDRLQALYDGEVEFGRKMSSGYYGKLDERVCRRELNMKITKEQLKQIIKEELSKALNEGGAVGHHPGINDLQRDISNVTSYINAWFNARAAGNTGHRGTNLSDYLRKGVAGEAWDPYSGRVSFKKALGEVAPENVEEFKELFMKLADGIEQDPSLLDPKKIGKEGNWYEVAKSL